MNATHTTGKDDRNLNAVSPATMDWLRWVGHTSVPLCKAKPDSVEVSGIASAWLLDFREQRVLVTAAHAVMNGPDWGVDLGPDRFGRNELYWPNHFSIIDNLELDFAATKVVRDLQPYYQERGPQGMIGEPVPYHVFGSAELVDPDPSEIFAFSGKIDPEMSPDNSFFRQPVVYPGLRLVENRDHKMVFKLPVDHPGHDAFRGCSGAPIVDRKRRCVGHVISGDASENLIFGVSIVPLLPVLAKI